MQSSAVSSFNPRVQLPVKPRLNRSHVTAVHTSCAGGDSTRHQRHPQTIQCRAQPFPANSRLLTRPIQAFQQQEDHNRRRYHQQQQQQQRSQQTHHHSPADHIIKSRDTSVSRSPASNPNRSSRSSSSGQHQKLSQASSTNSSGLGTSATPGAPVDNSSSSSSSSSCPHGSDSQASVMVCFLRAYGLQPADIDRLAAGYPQLFACSSDTPGAAAVAAAVDVDGTASTVPEDAPDSSEEVEAPYIHEASGMAAEAAVGAASPAGQQQQQQQCTSVYEVGRVLLFFHSLGWSHHSVLRRIVGLYPQLLTKQVERDILPVLRTLTDMGCSPADVQLLVWEFPRIFCSSNWRRHIRKFQYLGLYGLPAPGHSSSRVLMDGSNGGSSIDSTDSLERLMRWL